MEWVATIGVPLGIALAGVFGYLLRSRIEDLREAERRLSDDRRKIYSDLLSPYIDIFAEVGNEPEKVAQKFKPATMRRLGFNFMLIASDDVARAYNDFMQFTYKEGERPPWELLRL